MTQSMTTEKKILKLIINQFRRSIPIRIYFIENHLRFPFHFGLGKLGMKDKIAHQVDCPGKMLGKKNRINYRLFFCRISIQFPAHILHTVQYMP
ncbi:unknown [Bacteroides sp. CAG:144]|nr:unknown [Bacteroides sp. CAG:144]